MSKVLVLYYSTYGHIETMAQAIAEGVRSTGATADTKRVPETVPNELDTLAHFKLDQAPSLPPPVSHTHLTLPTIPLA